MQPGGFEELAEVALARTRELRLTLDGGIELAGRLPEEAERPLVAGVIPHARRYDAVLARHARHLAKSFDGICHEVNDQLGQGGVECSSFERQLLRRGAVHADSGVALSSRGNEGLRGIDGRHVVRSQPPDQLGRECAGAAADIEHSLTRVHCSEIGESRGERRRVPAHESVVLIGPDGEAHRWNLRSRPCPRRPE